MRYSVEASFKEEQKRGFIVTHTLQKEYETAEELSEGMAIFLSSYHSEYCHHMDFHVKESEDKL